MAIMNSMYSGWSGLRASNTQLGVIGDNIANVNTMGFKAGRAAFEEAMAQSLLGAGGLGSGTGLQAIQKILSQGALVQTGVATDLAIQGDGYFLLKGMHNGTEGSYYTRAGQFTIDKGGLLVNLDQIPVQGYPADATGAVGGMVGDLQVGNATSAPNPTSTLTLHGNLDASASPPPVTPFVAPPVATGPNQNYNFMHSSTIYDSLGNARQVDTYFARNATGAWDYFAMTDGANVTGGVAGTATQIGNGTLTYDTDGKLTTHTQASAFNPIGATQPQPLTFDFGDPTGAGGTGVGGMTQFAGTSTVSFNQQDGYASGILAGVQVDATGMVTGTFTNGQTRVLAQVAVAKFEAPDQLERLDGNLYSGSNLSGQADVGKAGSGGRGGVVSGSLEQSNVDLASEFIDMIAAQRSFQANSKTISTADQLLQELMQLKR